MTPGSRRLGTLALVASLALTACSGDDPTDAEPSPSASPTGTPTPTPVADPGPTEPALDDVDWQSKEHPGQPVGLERVGDQFFGTETRAVARLTATGEDVWRYRGPASDDFRGFVIGGIPVAVTVASVKSDGVYEPHDVHGLDPRTGKVRWTTRSTSSYAFSDGRHVVVPTCSGEETGQVGDCTLTAHDPATGDVAWSTPTYADVENTQVGDGLAVVQTFPTGDGPTFVVLDTATGDVRLTLQRPSGVVELLGDTLVDTGPADQPVSSGCRQQVTAYEIGGEARWQRAFRLGPQPYSKKRCSSYYAVEVGRDVALTTPEDAPALLVDGRTGRTLWKDSRPANLLHGSAGGVLVVQDQNENSFETRGVDPATGEVVWTYEGITGPWLTDQRYAAANYSCEASPSGSCTVVVDARSGEQVLHLPGVPEVFVPALPGGQQGLLTRVDNPKRYASTYAYTSLH